MATPVANQIKRKKLEQCFIRFLDVLHPANVETLPNTHNISVANFGSQYNLDDAYKDCGAMIYQWIVIAFQYCISWYEFLRGIIKENWNSIVGGLRPWSSRRM